jgi:hypothetical protein
VLLVGSKLVGEYGRSASTLIKLCLSSDNARSRVAVGGYYAGVGVCLGATLRARSRAFGPMFWRHCLRWHGLLLLAWA